MDNKFYKIGEIAKILGIAPSTLRYWENEFRQLKPHKSPGGQRFYNQKHIELLQKLKVMLYEQKFTIDGAKKRLKENDNELVSAPQVEPVCTSSTEPISACVGSVLSPDDIKKELTDIISMLKYRQTDISCS